LQVSRKTTESYEELQSEQVIICFNQGYNLDGKKKNASLRQNIPG
jgi:hypothetical protein